LRRRAHLLFHGMLPMAASSPNSARSGMRWSLASIFVFTFGVGVGLAYWRLTEHTVRNALVAGFGPWIVLGLGQRIERSLLAIRESNDVSRERRFGHLLQIGVSIGAIVLLGAVVALEIIRHFEPAVEGNGAEQFLLNFLTELLFFLSIAAAYWSPPTARVSRFVLVELMRSCCDLALLGLAGWWAATLLPEIVATISLVYIAIHGVTTSQPAFWAGRPFGSNFELCDPIQLQRDPFVGLMLLGACLLIGAMMISLWPRKWLRWSLLIALTPCLVGLVVLTHRAWTVDLPQLFPFFMAPVRESSLEMRAAWAVLVLTLGTGMAMSFTVTGQKIAGDVRPRVPLLHQQPAIVGICLVAVIGSFLFDIWSVLSAQISTAFWLLVSPGMLWSALVQSFQQVAIEKPQQLIRVAAAVVLVHALWHSWRGTAKRIEWRIEPLRFLTAQVIAVAALAALPTLMIWWAISTTLATWLS
jgi:hypothetical protein